MRPNATPATRRRLRSREYGTSDVNPTQVPHRAVRPHLWRTQSGRFRTASARFVHRARALSQSSKSVREDLLDHDRVSCGTRWLRRQPKPGSIISPPCAPI